MTRGGFQTHSIPDLMGYVAIVTGGNSGIGFETALQLALRHARVYIASRSAVRAENAIAKMRKSAEKAFVLDLSYLSLDLQDLQSVKQAAKDFMQRESRLDLLISNAGIMAVPFELTVDGYEKQWQTNYLSHHALFVSLLPLMRATAATSTDKNRVRVVLVSSSAGVSMGPKVMNYDDPNMKAMEGATGPWKRYAHSKLAMVMDAKAIHNLYRTEGISAFSLHPGMIKTNLQAADPTLVGSFIRFITKLSFVTSSIPDGARTTLFCATSPDAPQRSGDYIVPFGKVDHKADEWTNDKAAVEKLWSMSNKDLELRGIVEAV